MRRARKMPAELFTALRAESETLDARFTEISMSTSTLWLNVLILNKRDIDLEIVRYTPEI